MVAILDTTLRDGEQTPGVSFSTKEKLLIASELDRVGVEYIEAGTPAMGLAEKQALEEMLKLDLKAKIITWNRAVESDIYHSLDIGAQHIHISLPVSKQMIQAKLGKSESWVLNQLEASAKLVRQEGGILSVGAEDASRADDSFLAEYTKTAVLAEAERVRFCDTVGILNPLSLKEKFEGLIQSLPIQSEIHTHNDFGLATANALAAVQLGCEVVDTTVLGLGERAGNAALEELCMILLYHLNLPLKLDTKRLKPLATFVAKAAAREIPEGKSVVGGSIFYHESGIHADGVLKDPKNYEPFAPELVGALRRIVLGKHSGQSGLKHRLSCLGVDLSLQKAEILMARVRSFAIEKKREVSDEELMQLAQVG